MNKLAKFYEWGFRDNKYVWFHILAGGFGTALFGIWPMLILAVGWEMIEYKKDDIMKIYGSKERWMYDALGDVVGAILCGLLVLLG